jgi:uncharacterized protein YjbI with pentapeptide repeats
MKTLHIIVRHRANPNSKYANQWLDDDRVSSIVTHSEIADLCRQASASAAPVRIHRTGTGSAAPAVCCEAIVKAVRPAGGLFEVEFTNARTLHLAPSFVPDGKKSWYLAEAADVPSGEPTEPVAAPAPDAVPVTPTTIQTSNPGATAEVRPRPRHLELLEKGIDVWNFARQSKPDVKPELAGADLRQALRHSSSGQGVNLVGADLRGANLAGLKFDRAILIGADLEGADLTGAHWTEASQVVGGILMSIYRDECLDLAAADLSGADLSETRSSAPFLQGANFRRAKMAGADLSGSYLAGICFDEADLRGASLRGCNLTNASFDGCHLGGADLATATLKRGQIAKAITDGDTKLPADWDF